VTQGTLRDLQSAFAAYIRDPDQCAVPEGVDPVRMRVYSELFFNNIESFLSTGFPVLHAILEGPRWIHLVRDFYREHPSSTPLFVEIAGEFVTYLESERISRPDDLPFLKELAHYEWVELVLSVREAESPPENARFLEDPLAFQPTLSPLAWLLSYSYPVQNIGPEFQPTLTEQATVYLLVYRGRDEIVHFVELNAVTSALLSGLKTPSPVTFRERLEALAREIKHPDPAKVLEFGASLICDLHRKGAIAT
jgi:hypothetical protein